MIRHSCKYKRSFETGMSRGLKIINPLFYIYLL
uniref:Uncharacterized protein n=1 Tax=Anguilla anguilla TaxID=7936 RepID=A0A0E9WJ10_ANGAN